MSSSAQSETGAITINPDGTVTPVSSRMVKTGNIYTLQEDVFGRIVVEKDDIVIDGNSFLVQNIVSESTIGIKLENVKNVVIKNIHVKEFGYGISIKDSEEILIQHSSLEFNSFNGIEMINSQNVKVYENSFYGNQRGIELSDGSTQNEIYRNLFQDNNYGLSIDFSSNNHIYHNNFESNSEHVHSFGSENIWDIGYQDGGNYWDLMSFMDEYTGVDQDIPGSDGYSDESYDIDELNIDNYPFINPIDTDEPDPVEKTNLHVNIENESGSPIEGVLISVESDPIGSFNSETLSGVNGEATLKSINTGQYTVTVEKTDYYIEVQAITLTNSEHTLNVQMTHFPIILVFNVIDEKGEPIVGANVESIVQPLNQTPLSGTSNEEGGIGFEALTSGSYSWKFTASGFVEKILQIEVPGETVNEVSLIEEENTPWIPGYSLLVVFLGVILFVYIMRR